MKKAMEPAIFVFVFIFPLFDRQIHHVHCRNAHRIIAETDDGKRPRTQDLVAIEEVRKHLERVGFQEATGEQQQHWG